MQRTLKTQKKNHFLMCKLYIYFTLSFTDTVVA